MGDIFDEVKAMEDADLATGQESSGEAGDPNFNATELEDIMAEIDNLEKDFAAEVEIVEPQTVAMAASPAKPTAEIQTIVAPTAEIAGPIEEAEQDEPVATQVLSFEKKSAAPTLDAKSNVTLAASGDMSLNLTFKIGEEDATLVIDQEKGLLVTFSGVELSLHSENGCSVEMANGVLFSVPIQSKSTASKKKTA